MKIVILDGYTLNPGDLSWEGLQQFGELVVHDRTKPEDVIDRIAGASVVFTNKTPVTAAAIQSNPTLQYIGVLATGYNIVDVEAASQQGVAVVNVPGYGTASVVQLSFALLLELCLHVQKHSDAVAAGRWTRSADFCFWDYPLTELAGKTMGIIGFGNIGRGIATVAHAFGMKILVHSRRKVEAPADNSYHASTLEALLQASDVVSLHCPLTPDTKELINRDRLMMMKSSAFLLNTSRGPLIQEQDLADALNSGQIAGAGLDVLSSEPPSENNPLLHAKNCIITPHIAWASREARQRLMAITVSNLDAFLKGKPVNLVNAPKG
jgi:glycerate dehydrogenase